MVMLAIKLSNDRVDEADVGARLDLHSSQNKANRDDAGFKLQQQHFGPVCLFQCLLAKIHYKLTLRAIVFELKTERSPGRRSCIENQTNSQELSQIQQPVDICQLGAKYRLENALSRLTLDLSAMGYCFVFLCCSSSLML